MIDTVTTLDQILQRLENKYNILSEDISDIRSFIESLINKVKIWEKDVETIEVEQQESEKNKKS